MRLPKPHPAVLYQRISEGAILLHTEHEIYFGLNSVGVQVWEMLPPSCAHLDEICAALSRQYPDVPDTDLCSDVKELLDRLTAEGLVVAQDA